jgi:serine kinase of HPr protein (carbohydrate metabolism regulator)
MALAFIGIPRQTVAVHASVVIYANRAVLVLGESGTGKSTHTKLWLRHILGSRLLNDDSPVIRIELDENNQLVPFVYGSP